MKMYRLHPRFHWGLFQSFVLTIFQHWFRFRCCLVGFNPLSEPIMFNLLTHTRVTLLQWVKYTLWLTHWGRVMHICVGYRTIIGRPDNGLSPGLRQAIIWTNAGILLIEPLRTNFSEISIEIHTFSFKEMHLKMSGKWRPFVSASMC